MANQRTPSLKIIEHEPSLYTAWADDATGERLIEVECGTTTTFLLKIKLNAMENAAVSANPAALRDIAWKIHDHPDDFLSRRV